MKTYYTKCGRTFQKSTEASVTGYKMEDADQECTTCPFRIAVNKGYPAVFDHWECRAGSLPPNQKNDWRGSLEDKNTIGIWSLHNDFLESVMEYCKTADDISASYNQDLDDCRRVISVSCSGNKKGIAAKKALIEKFFPTVDAAPDKKVEYEECCENCVYGIDFGESVEFIKCQEGKHNKDVRKKQASCAKYVSVDAIDDESLNQSETCGTCDNYHPDAEYPGTGKCPEHMAIKAEGEKVCKDYKPSGKAVTESNKETPKRYVDDKNRLIFVSAGLGGERFMTMYQDRGWSNGMGMHRLKSTNLPIRVTIEEAQGDLNTYASKKGWKVACEMSMGCGPKDNVKCRINKDGWCGLDTASFEDMEAEASNCGFIRVNDRYLMQKYGVSFKDFRCRSCGHHDDVNCALRNEERYKEANACDDFTKRGVNEVIDSSQRCDFNDEECPYYCKHNEGCSLKIVKPKVISDVIKHSGDYNCDVYVETRKKYLGVAEDIPEEIAIELVNKPEDTIPSATTFDYSTVDTDTATFLMEKANNVTFINAGTSYAIGKELKEAQDKLANNRNGVFQSWCRSLNISEDTAYNYIHTFKFITERFGDIGSAKDFLALPQKLQYAVSKPSAPEEAVQQVLSGDIKTHKEYKEMEEKLKAIEGAAKTAIEASQKNRERADKAEERVKQLEKDLKQLSTARLVSPGEVTELQKQLAEAKKQVEILTDELMTPAELSTAVVEKVPAEIEKELTELRQKTSLATDYELVSGILGKLLTAHHGILKNWAAVIGQECSRSGMDTVRGELITIGTTIESMIDYLDEQIQMK